VNGFSEGQAIAKAGCIRIRDLWDQEDMEWKSLLTFEMNYHVINRISGISSFLTSFRTWLHSPAASKLGIRSTARQQAILPLSHGSTEWQKFSKLSKNH